MYDNLFDSIQGTTWYHRYNGDKIVVKDIIMDMDGTMQYVIETPKGGRSTVDSSFLNDYIQSDAPINTPAEAPRPQTKINFGEFFDPSMIVEKEPNKFILPTTRIDVGNLSELTPNTQTAVEVQTTTICDNYDIIHRALKKCSVPKVENKYIWDDFPQREIDMLVDIMDVSEEEIEEYLTSEDFIDECIGDIREDLRDFIRCKIRREDRVQKITSIIEGASEKRIAEVIAEIAVEADQKEIF